MFRRWYGSKTRVDRPERPGIFYSVFPIPAASVFTNRRIIRTGDFLGSLDRRYRNVRYGVSACRLFEPYRIILFPIRHR